MIDNILVSTEKGIITELDLDRVITEYMDKLPNAEMIYKNISVFYGLMDYINKCMIDKLIDHNRPYDISLLDTIFHVIYMPLCYRYGYPVNVIYYCVLVNIDYNHITDIVNGVYRHSGNIVNKELQSMIKKWFRVQESSISGVAMTTGNVGAIFTLKSIHAWQDNTTVKIESANSSPRLSADELEQIAESANDPLALPET